jgi:hypothetical protein|tara:strand:- start:51 stop:230 length:180 start_codon:yes stop_codon:yes gene_type:complete
MEKQMKEFLKDDLKKVEYHIQELIENIYARGNAKEFKYDIEEIESFFFYWKHHLKTKQL